MAIHRRRFTFSLLACIVAANSALTCLAADKDKSVAPTEEQKKAVKPFEPAFVVRGSTPHERGVAYGKQFGPKIREFLEQEIYTPFIGKPSSKEEMLRYAAACGKVVKEICPMEAEECQGIADGAGMTFDEVIL